MFKVGIIPITAASHIPRQRWARRIVQKLYVEESSSVRPHKVRLNG